MYIIACIRALAACTRECGAVIRFVRRRVLAEADITVYAKDNILDGELGNGRVGSYDFFCQGLGIAVPIFEGAAVFVIGGCEVSQSVIGNCNKMKKERCN